MGLEVLGETVDAIRQEGNLDLRRAGIGLVLPELLHDRRGVRQRFH